MDCATCISPWDTVLYWVLYGRSWFPYFPSLFTKAAYVITGLSSTRTYNWICLLNACRILTLPIQISFHVWRRSHISPFSPVWDRTVSFTLLSLYLAVVHAPILLPKVLLALCWRRLEFAKIVVCREGIDFAYSLRRVGVAVRVFAPVCFFSLSASPYVLRPYIDYSLSYETLFLRRH